MGEHCPGCNKHYGPTPSCPGLLSPEVVVAGIYMDRSIGDFRRACAVHIEEEQARPLPSNALIAVLCDAIRLSRELVALGECSGSSPEVQAAVEDALRDARHTLEWTKGSEPGWERGSIELIDKALAVARKSGDMRFSGMSTYLRERKGPP